MISPLAVKASHIEPVNQIGRTETERMKSAVSLVIRSIHRILVVARQEAGGKTGRFGQVHAPGDSEFIVVAVRDIAGDAGNAVVSVAVVASGVGDRAGKSAAAEDVGRDRQAAGARDRLKVGVGARLVQEKCSGVGEKTGFVVVSG